MWFGALILAAAVAVVSSDVLADGPPPRYVHARYLTDEATRKVTELSALKKPEDWLLPSSKREYAILLGVLDKLSEYFSRGCPYLSYDQVYLPVVNDTVPYAWEYPEHVVGRLDTLLAMTYVSIQNLHNLMDDYCPEPRAGNAKEIDCDTVVNLQVLLHPELYQRDADMFLAMANLAELYLRQPYQEVAHRNGIIPLLITGKDKLRDLVSRIAVVKRIVYGTTDECKKKSV